MSKRAADAGLSRGRSPLTPGGSLSRLVAWRLYEKPGFELLWVEDDGPWSVAALAYSAAGLAIRLAEAGVGRGDPVLLRVGNDERFLPALTAIWSCGAVAVAMHPATPPIAAREAASEMGTSVVVCPPDDLFASDPSREVITVEHIEAAEPGSTWPGAVELLVPEIADGDTALVLLTSGSTGKPKGVRLSHANLWANLRSTVRPSAGTGTRNPFRILRSPPT